MSEHEIPRNFELEPDPIEHIDDAHLRYKPETMEQMIVPFDPVVVDTYPDGRPRKGVCGRDEHGRPIVPIELRDIAIIETPIGHDFDNEKIRKRFVEIDKPTWPIFVNPPAEVISERDAWQDEGEGK